MYNCTFYLFSAPEPSDTTGIENCVAIHSANKQWDPNGDTPWEDVQCCFNDVLQINAVACKKRKLVIYSPKGHPLNQYF